MHFIVTGAAGYLGSHMAKLLQQAGHTLTLIDNLINTTPESAQYLSTWPGCAFFQTDITDHAALLDTVSQSILLYGPAQAVFHFAGLKSVEESIREPARYYHNNVTGTLNILSAMKVWHCPTIIFSSSATVYGDSDIQPIPETAQVKPTNPYGHSKAMCEQLLLDVAKSDPQIRVAILRYFNPVGAHPDGDIGENPKGTPANLMPYLCQVALGDREHLYVYGDDYPTVDGTGVRDYIHVCDLIEGHWAAYSALSKVTSGSNNALVCNLGTGTGASVLSLVHMTRQVSGREVQVKHVARRPGDVAMAVADTRHAHNVLNWEAKRDLRQMVKDHLRFMRQQKGLPV